MSPIRRHRPGELGSDPIPDDLLLADVIRVWLKLQRPPTWSEYNEHGMFSTKTVTNRFGKWKTFKRSLGLPDCKNNRGGRAPDYDLSDVEPEEIGLSATSERNVRADGGRRP